MSTYRVLTVATIIANSHNFVRTMDEAAAATAMKAHRKEQIMLSAVAADPPGEKISIKSTIRMSSPPADPPGVKTVTHSIIKLAHVPREQKSTTESTITADTRTTNQFSEETTWHRNNEFFEDTTWHRNSTFTSAMEQVLEEEPSFATSSYHKGNISYGTEEYDVLPGDYEDSLALEQQASSIIRLPLVKAVVSTSIIRPNPPLDDETHTASVATPQRNQAPSAFEDVDATDTTSVSTATKERPATAASRTKKSKKAVAGRANRSASLPRTTKSWLSGMFLGKAFSRTSTNRVEV